MEPCADPSFLTSFGEPGARGIRTERGFAVGEVVCAIPCTALRERPMRHTVQKSDAQHLEVGVLATLNHSCDPNVRLDTDRMLVVAERDIAPGEELSYFYPSTEWDMAEPFACHCGSPVCLGMVRGARHIPAEVLGRYYVNSHIRRRREELNAGAVPVVEIA